MDKVAISPDGSHVGIVATGGIIDVWNVKSGKYLMREIKGLDAVFDHKGTSVAILGYDDEVGIWDLQTQRRVRELKSQVQQCIEGAIFGPDDKWLVVTSSSGTKVIFAQPGKFGSNRWELDSSEQTKNR